MRTRGLLAFVVVSNMGCFNSPFVRNDGPAQAQGVTVSLISERCDFEPDWDAQREDGSYPNRLDIGMRIVVENQTPQPITIDPHNLRIVGGGSAAEPSRAPESRSIKPGARESFDVRFRRQGDLACNAPLSLALDKLVQVGNQPVPLRSVSFVAKATES
jgi:hypothetical protein